jgi:hypothetical protein
MSTMPPEEPEAFPADGAGLDRPARHSVLLVREWDQQMSGSGCCGRLGGIGNDLSRAEDFAPARAGMQAMGEVYMALRTVLPEETVELTVVDPRNTIWLVPRIVRDARRRGMPAAEVWSQVRRGTGNGSVVVDGAVVCSGELPPPPEVVARVRAEIAAVESSRS